MIIKCKMCGGDIQFNPGDTYGQCDHCGCTSTIPRADDEQKLNRYNRANHFRRQGEFDKAIAAYERILEEDDTDAEAHWGAALSRYGIEYVEDPATKKQVPTCHRVRLESILADADYLAAIEHAPDSESKRIYEEHAKEIAEIQKDILAISANEKPYDVFICYKETDDNGQRTKDSTLAQEVYYGLIEQGYKVFFSRITLEDKLGQQYEPYIFAALNSARVMVVIGTKPEYFNAVWVKNEWSRYLHLMKNDRKRLLIPCYRDMDPYDLPEELGNLQSQDMSRIGFIQDLLRGIRKVLETEKEKATPSQPVVQQVIKEHNNVDALLDRALLCLEDRDYEKADEFCEQALNLDARNSRAYLVKLMIERKVQKEEDLAIQKEPLEKSTNYQRALRFANPEQKEKLENWNQTILERIEHIRKYRIREDASNRLKTAKTVEECNEIKETLRSIESFEGVQQLIEECDQKAEEIQQKAYTEAEHLLDIGQDVDAQIAFDLLKDYKDSREKSKEAQYRQAIRLMGVEQYSFAIQIFEKLGDYSDSKGKIQECDKLNREKIEREQAEKKRIEDERVAKQLEDEERKSQEAMIACRREAEKKRKARRRVIILVSCLGVILAGLAAYIFVLQPMQRYNQAITALNNGNETEAIQIFTENERYSDSKQRIQQANANIQYKAGNYAQVVEIYTTLDKKYQDHADDLKLIYDKANQEIEDGQYDNAIAVFSSLGTYLDCADRINEANYQKAMALSGAGKRDEATQIFKALGTYKESWSMGVQLQGDSYYDKGNYSEAWKYYSALEEKYQTHKADYERMYTSAEVLLFEGKYDEAISAFSALGAYEKSEEMVKEARYQKAAVRALEGKYQEAVALYTELGEYKDSSSLALKANADELYDNGNIASAYDIYISLSDDYQTHALEYKTLYDAAMSDLNSEKYGKAYEGFVALGNYSDSKSKAVECGRKKAEGLFAEGNFSEAASAYAAIGDNEKATASLYQYANQLSEQENYVEAAKKYTEILEYKDSRELRYQAGIKAKADGKLLDAFEILNMDVDYNDATEELYQIGVSASEQKNYKVSVASFTVVGTYKDAAIKLTMDTYAWGEQLFENKEYDQSAEVFTSMGDFSDASSRAMQANYAAANQLLGEGNYETAKERFQALGDYNDCSDKIKECDYLQAKGLYENKKYKEALNILEDARMKEYKESASIIKDCQYQIGKGLMGEGKYNEAISWLDLTGEYLDSVDLANEARYQAAMILKNEAKYSEAISAFTKIETYKDSKEQIKSCNDALGASYEKAGEYEKAYDFYSLSGNAEKISVTAYQVGVNKATEGNNKDAISWFVKAGEYEPAKDRIIGIAESYYTTQDIASAEDAFSKVSEYGIAPQRLYEIGQYYELAGKREEAVRAYQEAGNYRDANDRKDKIQEVLNEEDYVAAEAKMKSEDYSGALALFKKISGYRDADIRAADASRQAKLKPFRTKGNTVTFGSYEQDDSSSNGKEPIKWIVLDVKEGKSLLLSYYALEAKAYHSRYTEVTWSTCALRSWLNDTFYNDAFSSIEHDAILVTTVDNSTKKGKSGPTTNDRVYLLSYKEAFEVYFTGDNERVCSCTKHAQSRVEAADGVPGVWWLRTCTDSGRGAFTVWYDGHSSASDCNGGYRNSGSVDKTGVRPVLWIDLNSEYFSQ